MHIFLYGASGSGKSTVGKLLSHALNLPFLDLDTQIEDVAGQPVPQIMTEQGEPAFRDAESNALQKAVLGEEKVIALGGGALLRAENRALADAVGQIVLLDTGLPTLVARLLQDENERPLLAGELEAKLAGLLERRREHYASFPLRADASQAPEQVAWDIQRLLGRYHLRGMGAGYDVIVQEDPLPIQTGSMISKHTDSASMIELKSSLF